MQYYKSINQISHKEINKTYLNKNKSAWFKTNCNHLNKWFKANNHIFILFNSNKQFRIIIFECVTNFELINIFPRY